MKTLMRNGRDRRSENPFLGHAKKERVSLFGTDQRITSGPAARRPHSKAEYMTAPERFADSQIPLAPRAPSIHDPKRSFRLFRLTVQDGSGGAPHIVGTETMRQEPAQVTRTERFCGGIRTRPAPPLAAVPRHGREGSPRRASDGCPQSCPRLRRPAALRAAGSPRCR